MFTLRGDVEPVAQLQWAVCAGSCPQACLLSTEFCDSLMLTKMGSVSTRRDLAIEPAHHAA